MKLIDTTQAVGHVLCHDLTRIIPGEFKGPAFKKGHIVAQEDIPVLLSMGKEHLYVYEKAEGMLHEDEAAEILRQICQGSGLEATEPSEGKIELRAAFDGLLQVDSALLREINSLGEIAIASRHGRFPVKQGDMVAGMRVVPLVIDGKKMDRAKELAKGKEPVFRVLPFKTGKAAIITTGSEVEKGLIKDGFTPVVEKKLSEYHIGIFSHAYSGDDEERIIGLIRENVEKGADLVICTGGMSVDPDDKTPGAISRSGAKVVSYGAPVLPGAMFLLAYYEHEGRQIPVMGLPGCVMYAGRTIFDLVLPRVLAGEKLTASDMSAYGEGGLCLKCKVCTFPNCGFGK